MKILAINWLDLKNPQAGGAEVHLQEILSRIASQGNQVTLLCCSFEGAAKEECSNGIRIIRCGSRYTFNLALPFVLKSLVKENQYDIVVEDINKIPFYTPLLHNLPLLVIIPHLFATTIFREINFILGLYIYLSEKPIPHIYRNRKFMVISESTKEDLVKRGIESKNISIIKCGIDHNLYKPGLTKHPFPTAIYVGRIRKYKSIQHLVLAFNLVLQRIPNAKLMIVGDGDYLPNLKKLAKKLNLEEKIEFTGYVNQQEKVERLQKSNVAVCPSLKEGWGLTNIEANACGIPVIASNVPGLKDSVIDGKTGLLFDYGDIKDLADKIVNVLSNQELQMRLVQGGLEWAKSYSWDKTADEALELIKSINEKGRG